MASEVWVSPRCEVVLRVETAPARHVLTNKRGARYAIEHVSFRFRRLGWDGEWRLIQETFIPMGRAAHPIYGPQLGSVPDWLDDLREKARLEVQVHS